MTRCLHSSRKWKNSRSGRAERRASTTQALAKHFYDFTLADGRKLGDLRADELTEPAIGTLLNRMREKDDTGKPRTSMALREHVRCPLKR